MELTTNNERFKLLHELVTRHPYIHIRDQNKHYEHLPEGCYDFYGYGQPGPWYEVLMVIHRKYNFIANSDSEEAPLIREYNRLYPPDQSNT